MKLSKKVILAFSFVIIILVFSIIAMKENSQNITKAVSTNAQLS